MSASSERRQIGRIGGFTSWANTEDRTARTQLGRAAFLKRFDDQVDPERRLSPQERAKRADAAKKAYFASLALKSAKARRRGAVQYPDEAAAGTSGMSVEQVAESARALTAEQRLELAALLLTGGGQS